MPLSCSCDWDCEPEPGMKQLDLDNTEFDFVLFEEKRRKRCASCNELISIGNECLKFEIVRQPHNEIEARIHGLDFDQLEEPVIKIAPMYHCEKCAEIFLNLTEVGFECIYPSENMPKMLKQYQTEYAPPKLIL